jgi:hypothetical protein
MAEQWLAMVSNGRSQRPASEREVRLVDDTVVKLTTECLTRPYDKELVSCVGRASRSPTGENGGVPRTCLARFEARAQAK